MKRPLLLILVLAPLIVSGCVYAYHGWHGINVMLRRGMPLWKTVSADDARISPSMRLALATPTEQAHPGKLSWKEISPGFEAGELSAIAAGNAVDGILLARIDPSRFRFEVHTSPSGEKELGDWMKELGASLVINGSYYARRGTPETPVVSGGKLLGPAAYDAKHGAFIASDAFTGIADLAVEDWRKSLVKAHDAMVSYPLLLASDGSSRTGHADRRWLANRTFIGQDNKGRIIIGTTQEAFFSLEQLAVFLKQAPLELTMALNLDGGPLACQGISLNGFQRDFCGDWEIQVSQNELKLLRPALGTKRWALPIVLAVSPKAGAGSRSVHAHAAKN